MCRGCVLSSLLLLKLAIGVLLMSLSDYGGRSAGLDNGLALTPPMGWLTWQRFRCQTDCEMYPQDCVSEALVVRQAQMLAHDGWLARGYEYIIIDDCWPAHQRDPTSHRLQPDPTRFPHGMKWLSDFVHSLGLKFGIYLDFGTKTCAGFPGSLDFLEVDAATMADWGVDYIKMDGCYSDPKIQPDGYAMFERLLNATKRPIVFSCSYPAYQHWFDGEKLNWSQLAENCNIWRMLDDVQDSWASILSIMRDYEAHRKTLIPVAGPGHWNDLDMLTGGNFGLSWDETRVQMGVWAMHASPLIISLDLATVRPEVKEILQAPLVIRVSQDKLGKPADLLIPVVGIKVWKRKLSDFNAGWALAFLNLSDEGGFPRALVISLLELGIPPNGDLGCTFNLIDAFTGSNLLTTNSAEAFEVRINPSGIVMLIVQPL
ncbi:Alpha N acetylgalactosaminidase [Echinococcus multilocularis]|uniref:Alpha-galactosidase n=1 Tax=Echinococcus multilocularis TaxID=6211 RepID=A0A068Y1K3_ECHMU|nr:Alpha N acetylgalactosaminidase [Echinococcus multilocularis]